MSRATVRVGTSGYSFADWVGPFYPKGTDKSKMLDYYTQHFNTVEINSTYYGIPHPRVFENMVKKTKGDFDFMVKAHESATHKRNLLVQETPKYLDAIRPLQESGKLKGILMQFPWSFPKVQQHVEHLGRCSELFRGFPIFAEFRHSSWIQEETFAILKALKIGYVSVDEPQLEKMIAPIAVATSDTGYVRFHGRNAEKWYSGFGSERYNYLYSDGELREWVGKINKLRENTLKMYIFFNNCHLGQAVINAKRILEMLDANGN